jgi:ferredoxin
VYSRILILRFPKEISTKPVVCYLTKKYDLIFNILNATVLPRREGILVLELSGNRKSFKEGVRFLKDQGIQVENASQEVQRVRSKCTHCGACTAVCPTGALTVQRPKMTVRFDQKKCSVCELCVPACPTRAMEVLPSRQSTFA